MNEYTHEYTHGRTHGEQTETKMDHDGREPQHLLPTANKVFGYFIANNPLRPSCSLPLDPARGAGVVVCRSVGTYPPGSHHRRSRAVPEQQRPEERRVFEEHDHVHLVPRASFVVIQPEGVHDGGDDEREEHEHLGAQ